MFKAARWLVIYKNTWICDPDVKHLGKKEQESGARKDILHWILKRKLCLTDLKSVTCQWK